MRRLLHSSVAALAFLWLATPALAEPEVAVTLDAAPTEARVGEMIRLEVQVRVKGGSIEELQLADLKKYPELEIVSHQTVRPMQFSFGFGQGVQVESSLGHVYVIRPTAPGEYRFSPAVAKVDGELYRSQTLTLVVHPGTASAGAPDAGDSLDSEVETELTGARLDARAFLRTVVEPEDAYVGQQVNVTVYLYTRLRLGPQSVIPTKPDMAGFWVYDDPISSLQAQTVLVNGVRYQVYPLHRSVAFPQRTGELTVGPPRVSFDVGGLSFFDAPERVEREGVPVVVRVKPLPSPAPPNVVVGTYKARAWLDRAEVTTGDAVTLRVNASGIGNVQDLRIDLPPIVGVRALQPSIRDQQRLDANRQLAGTRAWEWILIAEGPGEHVIPPIEIRFFDPKTEQYGAATTPALTFTATGQAKPSGPAIEPVEPRPRADASSFGPISMYSALRRAEAPVRSRSWFGWLLGFPPVSFALLVIGVAIARRREWRSTTPGAVQRKLISSARDALQSDDPRSFYDRIVASITHALDTRLGEPVGGLPHADLRKRLTEAEFDDDLVQRVINELDGADFARFAASGVNQDEMERCLQRTAAIVERIERTKGAA